MNKNKKIVSFVCAIAMIFTMLSSFTFASAAEEGFTLSTPVVSTDGKTITFDVGYVNITSGVASGHFDIDMPSEVTSVDSGKVKTATFEDGKFSCSFMYGAEATEDTAGTITTLTLHLSTPLKYDNQLKFDNNAYIDANDGTSLEVGSDGVLASNVVLPAFGGTEPTPDVKGSIELKKAVTVKVSDTPAEGVSQYFIIPVVKNADGSNAKYEDDFVTNYNGTKLTEDQYDNLLNGYFTADNVKDLGVTSMEDVVNGLSYSLYNSNITVAAQLVNRATGEIQNGNDTEQSLTPAKPTAKPSEPSISVKASSTTVDKKFTVTATVKNAKDGAKVAFTTNDDEKYAVIFGTPTEINSKGETKATYVANDKAGTVTITATYTDTEGNEKSASVKVTVKKASTTTGGNNGTTSGGGPGIIAPGNTGAVTTPNTNTNYKPDFQDLDSVEWARTAINGLAMRGMINGRDQYTFDPNANITRAEYCQILMGAINALNAKGESTFADVPSTAWYYNAVSVASQLGIVSGYGDGNFGPNDLITRQDMALMTYKTAKIMNKSLEPVNAEITFEDSHEISDYAFEAVMTLQKAGIINGMTETTFEPHSNATRAQSAKVIFDTFVDAQ